MDTFSNNPPSTRDVTLDVDEMISVASDQPAAPNRQHLPIISTSNTHPIYHQPTFNINLVPTLVQTIATQSSVSPVPPHIRDRIIHGEFIDFASFFTV